MVVQVFDKDGISGGDELGSGEFKLSELIKKNK